MARVLRLLWKRHASEVPCLSKTEAIPAVIAVVRDEAGEVSQRARYKCASHKFPLLFLSTVPDRELSYMQRGMENRSRHDSLLD